MLMIHDALQAHARCTARFIDCLCQKQADPERHCLEPQNCCNLVRFLNEAEAAHGSIPEIAVAHTAHTTVHAVILGLVQKNRNGQPVNIDIEFGPSGNFGSASSSLVSSLWRIERKLHTMAG